MSISRRKFLLGMTAAVATPAVIRWSGVMPINAAQATPFATVSGIDLSGKSVIHKLWEPTNVNLFAGTAEFNNMAAVHSWNYASQPILQSYHERYPESRMVLKDETVDQIIANRILKEEQRRKEWREDPAWTIYGTIGTDDFTSNKFTEDGPIRKPWELL
jgi:hypothetical protein